MIAIDAKDSAGNRDAELHSLCSPADFDVAVSQSPPLQPQLHNPYSLEPAVTFYSTIQIQGSASAAFAARFPTAPLCQPQYYAAKFIPREAGEYTLSSTLAGGSSLAGAAMTIFVDADVASVTSSNISGVDDIAKSCIQAATCSSAPRDTLAFKMQLHDIFGNPRYDRDVVAVTAACTVGGVSSSECLDCGADGCAVYGGTESPLGWHLTVRSAVGVTGLIQITVTIGAVPFPKGTFSYRAEQLTGVAPTSISLYSFPHSNPLHQRPLTGVLVPANSRPGGKPTAHRPPACPSHRRSRQPCRIVLARGRRRQGQSLPSLIRSARPALLLAAFGAR